jgi:hypothetical protein
MVDCPNDNIKCIITDCWVSIAIFSYFYFWIASYNINTDVSRNPIATLQTYSVNQQNGVITVKNF